MTRASTRFPALLVLLTAVALALAPAGAAADDDENIDIQKRKAALVLKLRINRAIDKGAAWLATQQQRDGAFHLEGNPSGGIWPGARHEFGETALATYTLAHCGFGPEQKVIKRALAYMNKHWRSQMKGEYHPRASAYSLCLLVLALHELYATPGGATEAEHDEKYGNARIKKGNPCGFPNWARKIVDTVLDWLMENQAAKGLFRYPGGLDQGGGPGPGPGGPGGPGGPRGPGGPGGNAPGTMPPGFMQRGPEFFGPEDLSNTQYVLLALWVGSRCGYDIDPERMQKMARRLLEWQQPNGQRVGRVCDPGDGDKTKRESRYDDDEQEHEYYDAARGFGYTPGDPPTGSMTAAGLSSLVTIKGMLQEKGALTPELRKSLDHAIWDAIAWLQVNFTVHENPPLGHEWHYYYLYGLERALVIADKRFLGENDWYMAGAKLLVDAQQKSGQWTPTELMVGQMMPGMPAYSMSLVESCFALLFLKRAAFKPDEPILSEPVITPDAGDGK